MKKALFLDRDGTINKYGEYIYKISDFEFIDGAIQFIKKFNDLNWYVFVVSNQAGIGRGFYSEKDLFILQAWVDAELLKQGAHIDEWFFCPHHPIYGIGEYKIDCNCRKPNTGMIEQAFKKYDLDLQNSIMVGDKQWDIECGERAGLHSYMLGEGGFLKVYEQIKRDKLI